jgi:hypothetical protein
MDDRRYYGLDALRGGMMMLGIVLHAATLYLASPPPHAPFTTDPNNSYAMDLLFDFIHSFRMPVFFVLAGFFSSLLVENAACGERTRTGRRGCSRRWRRACSPSCRSPRSSCSTSR